MNRTHQTPAIRRRDFFAKFSLLACLPATLAATTRLGGTQHSAARPEQPGAGSRSTHYYYHYDSKGRVIESVTYQ